MESLHTTASRALRTLLADQPASAAKVRFAWQMVAGGPIARASDASWRDGVLRVRPSTAAWRREITRARPILLERLRHLLGPEVVRSLIVEAAGPPPAPRLDLDAGPVQGASR
jgi:hypothetical protein